MSDFPRGNFSRTHSEELTGTKPISCAGRLSPGKHKSHGIIQKNKSGVLTELLMSRKLYSIFNTNKQDLEGN
jgi:hypothetical protein